MKNKTNTVGWKIVNSLWILLTFAPIVGWAGFLYAAIKTRDKFFIISTAIHAAIQLTWVVGLFTRFGQSDFVAVFFVLDWIVIVIHAVASRERYLRTLKKRKDRELLGDRLQEERFALRDAAVLDRTQPAQNPVNYAAAVEAPVYEAPAVSMTLVNVNDCDEAALAALPGLSIVDAKKAIAYREQNGAFPTVESFIATLGIKPHIAVQLTGRITVGPTAGSRGRTGGGVVRQLDF